MSLAIVAVTPEGIVMGVDSAITSRSQDPEYSLAGFPKIIKRPRAVQAVAFVGDFGLRQNSSWIAGRHYTGV